MISRLIYYAEICSSRLQIYEGLRNNLCFLSRVIWFIKGQILDFIYVVFFSYVMSVRYYFSEWRRNKTKPWGVCVYMMVIAAASIILSKIITSTHNGACVCSACGLRFAAMAEQFSSTGAYVSWRCYCWQWLVKIHNHNSHPQVHKFTRVVILTVHQTTSLSQFIRRQAFNRFCHFFCPASNSLQWGRGYKPNHLSRPAYSLIWWWYKPFGWFQCKLVGLRLPKKHLWHSNW